MITIIAVGKLGSKYEELLSFYKSKISFFAKVKIIEIKEVNHKNINITKEKETKKVLEVIPKNNFVFLCSIKGKSFSSKEFSNFFNENKQITFIIGGSYGFDEELLSKFINQKISFSKMTFPHKLFRIFLFEQIFRSFSIIKNMKYHK